jgi:hypothetical protein
VFRDRVFFHKNTFCRYVILEMFRLLFDGKSSESEFLLQALSMSLVEWVMGNIAGVATAIALRTRLYFDVDGCFFCKYRFCRSYFSSNL